MAKTSSTKSKSATKAANSKTAKPVKEKREPSAYNIFVKAQMGPWLKANPGKKVTDGMKQLGAIWRDHPDNPNRGKSSKSKPSSTSKGKENVLLDSDDTIPSSDA